MGKWGNTDMVKIFEKLTNCENIKSFMKKVNLISSELDEKINLLKKILEESLRRVKTIIV